MGFIAVEADFDHGVSAVSNVASQIVPRGDSVNERSEAYSLDDTCYSDRGVQ